MLVYGGAADENVALALSARQRRGTCCALPGTALVRFLRQSWQLTSAAMVMVMTIPTDSYGVGSYLGECPLVQASDDDSLSPLGNEARWCESTSDVRWRTGGTTVMVRALTSSTETDMAAATALAEVVFPLLDVGEPEAIQTGVPSPMPATVKGARWCEEYWTLQTAYWPDSAALGNQLDRVIDVADDEGNDDVVDFMEEIRRGRAGYGWETPLATIHDVTAARVGGSGRRVP